jgi:hypothetical protein
MSRPIEGDWPIFVGEDADDVGAPLDLAVEALEWIDGVDARCCSNRTTPVITAASLRPSNPPFAPRRG